MLTPFTLLETYPKGRKKKTKNPANQPWVFIKILYKVAKKNYI